ncbi:glycosyltransferase family 61 protein [Muricoccus radiodurans]|uniref:glycosyltransferase family 61 protein n=1 Tax=Muricoccus radiodurans TaxID=2231721 RepID=UPI003CE6F454
MTARPFPIGTIARLPVVADIAALTQASRGCLELAPGGPEACETYPAFRQGAEVTPPKAFRRDRPPLRIGVVSGTVILGGGAVLDPETGGLLVESMAAASEGTLGRPDRLRQPLQFLGLRPEGGRAVPERPWKAARGRIEGPVFHLTYRTDPNYSHFMTELLPKLYYWQLLPEPRPRLLLSEEVAGRLLPLLGLYGIEPRHVVTVPAVRQPPVIADRVYVANAPMLLHAPVLAAVRGAAGGPAAGPRRLHVLRRGPKAWFRRLLNEDRVGGLLGARGFVPVVLEDLSLPDQVALFRGAECVAGVYGGGLFNTVFSPPSLRLLSLTSAEYHRAVLDSMPGRPQGATVVGEAFSTKVDGNNAPFVVDLRAVEAACDLLRF